MLNDLPVGKKMSLGFGTLIALFLVVTLTFAISTAHNAFLLEEAKNIAAIQSQTSNILNGFNQTSHLANTVILEIDHEAFANYEEQTDTLLTAIGRILRDPSLLQTGMSLDQMNQLEAHILEWKGHIQGVQQHNHSLEDKTEGIVALSDSLSEAAIALYQEVLLNAAAQGEMNSVQMESVYLLVQQVEQVSRGSAKALLIYDTSDIAINYNQIEQAVATLDSIPPSGLSAGAGNAASRLRGLLVQYRQAMEDFTEESEESTRVHEIPAYQLADEISGQIVAISAEIEDVLHEHVNRAVFISTLALLLGGVIFAAAMIAGILLAIRITRSIASPLSDMKELLLQVARGGNMNFSDEETAKIRAAAQSKDEVGLSVAAFWEMLQRLTQISECMEAVANRDIRVSIAPLSTQDVMGNSLLRMCNNLNQALKNIQVTAHTVSGVSQNTAASSQDLAQNTTEQSATIHQLEASISRVADQARNSLERAKAAAEHSEDIRNAAQTGNQNIRQLMQSVEEINNASKLVQNVIRVIEDIAFQTNILALNAAVEAAHVGHLGRGFAVVADEVRNLAAKSAAAAKDSTQLILGTIEKTEQGLVISEQTAQFLSGIIAGIGKTSADMDEITGFIETQFNSIEQINLGIQEASSVIEQNSATAQEVAATSQEMSAQAQMLHNIAGRFRLRSAEEPVT